VEHVLPKRPLTFPAARREACQSTTERGRSLIRCIRSLQATQSCCSACNAIYSFCNAIYSGSTSRAGDILVLPFTHIGTTAPKAFEVNLSIRSRSSVHMAREQTRCRPRRRARSTPAVLWPSTNRHAPRSSAVEFMRTFTGDKITPCPPKGRGSSLSFMNVGTVPTLFMPMAGIGCGDNNEVF
jgi:hypothetical protein